MREIDITGSKFDFVDFSEGNIFFDSFSEKEEFEIKVWGVTLMNELDNISEDFYINSISNILFENVSYINLRYSIYANKEYSEFLKDEDGKEKVMNMKLGKKAQGYTEYLLGGILGRYIGYGEITLLCKGKVKIRYDENSLVSIHDYCLNPQRYQIL